MSRKPVTAADIDADALTDARVEDQSPTPGLRIDIEDLHVSYAGRCVVAGVHLMAAPGRSRG